MDNIIAKIFIEYKNYIIFSLISLYFIRYFFLTGTFTNLKKNMKGKVVIVTGASAGIGKATAEQLLEAGAEVVYACRDKAKTMKVFNEIEKKNKDYLLRAHFIELNLDSFKSVNNFICEFNSKFEKLDILINNAASFPTKFYLTEDGIESILQANYMSAVFLTMKLLDKFNNDGRIINYSSFAHVQSNFKAEDFEKMKLDRDFNKINVTYYGNMWLKHHHYSNTKTSMILFTSYLNEYLEKHYKHIKAASLNPGMVYTEFARFIWKHPILGKLYKFFSFIYKYLTKTALSGAQTALHLCYIDFGNFIGGGYYSNCKLSKASKVATNNDIRNHMMDYTFFLINNREKLVVRQ